MNDRAQSPDEGSGRVPAEPRQTTASDEGRASTSRHRSVRNPGQTVQIIHALGEEIRLCGFMGTIALVLGFFIILIFRCPEAVYPNLNELLKMSGLGWVVASVLLLAVFGLIGIMHARSKGANQRIKELADQVRQYQMGHPNMAGRPTSRPQNDSPTNGGQ